MTVIIILEMYFFITLGQKKVRDKSEMTYMSAHEVEFTVSEAIVTWWCCGSMAVFFQLFHITTSEMQSINLLQQTQISKVQIKTIISKVLPAWSQPAARRSGLRKSRACLSVYCGCLMDCLQSGSRFYRESRNTGRW